MTPSAVFHERKRKSLWEKLFWAFAILVAILSAIYFATNTEEWSWKTGAKPVAIKAVVVTPLRVASAPVPAATASAPICECKCDCCAKKPVVKKVVKKKPRPVHKKQTVEIFLPNKPAPVATPAPQITPTGVASPAIPVFPPHKPYVVVIPDAVQPIVHGCVKPNGKDCK